MLLLNYCSSDLVIETVGERGEEKRRFHNGHNVVLIVTIINCVPADRNDIKRGGATVIHCMVACIISCHAVVFLLMLIIPSLLRLCYVMVSLAIALLQRCTSTI